MKKKAARPSPKKISPAWWWVAGAAVFLLLLYVVAPPVILKVLNRNLNKNPMYSNHVGGLVLHPLRGGYTLEDFSIRRKLGDTLVPVFTAKTIDVSMPWSSVVRGSPRAQAVLREPRLNLVAQFFDPKRKKKPGAWQRTFDLFHVFPVDRIAVEKGAIHFLDFSKSPRVDVHLDTLEGSVSGLTVARGRDSGSTLPTVLKARARLMNQAPLRVQARMLPGADDPTLELRAELRGFRLANLNGAFRAYAGLDVEKGTLSLRTRVVARDGRFEGVVHRRAEGFEILDPESDDDDGFWQLAWEATADLAAKWVEERADPEAARTVPVSGSFEPQAETWAALGDLLRGTFARALDPRLGKSLEEGANIDWDSPEVTTLGKLLPP